jgi:hypothetical protein
MMGEEILKHNIGRKATNITLPGHEAMPGREPAIQRRREIFVINAYDSSYKLHPTGESTRSMAIAPTNRQRVDSKASIG